MRGLVIGTREGGRKHPAKAGEKPVLVFLRQFMLPDAKNTPALRAEGPGHEAITSLIAGKFFPPERGVVPRFRGVHGAAVPEAAVDEDREFQFGKNKVWFAEQRSVSPPACDAVRTENRDQTQLGVAISTGAYGCHHRGTFLLREDVRHLDRGRAAPSVRYASAMLTLPGYDNQTTRARNCSGSRRQLWRREPPRAKNWARFRKLNGR